MVEKADVSPGHYGAVVSAVIARPEAVSIHSGAVTRSRTRKGPQKPPWASHIKAETPEEKQAWAVWSQSWEMFQTEKGLCKKSGSLSWIP